MTKPLTNSQISTLAIIKRAGAQGRDYLTREKGYNIGSTDALISKGLVRWIRCGTCPNCEARNLRCSRQWIVVAV